MAAYRCEGSILVTQNAARCYSLGIRPGQYGDVRRTLYRSQKGSWWIETQYSWTEEGMSLDRGEFVTPREAILLALTDGSIPPDQFAEENGDLAEMVTKVLA